MTTLLQKLNNDDHYYGEVGKKFLSSSSIGDLLDNPEAFGTDRAKTPEMVKGSYFHSLVLEPEKVKDFRIVSASSRNTNKYRDEAGDDVLLLEPEARELEAMAQKIESNYLLYEMVHIDTTGYEVPAIGELFGAPFKGKADIVKPTMIVDLKTTSRIDEFKYSAKKYNYDVQAYVYKKLFGVPVTFLVIEKGSLRTSIIECSDNFLASGEAKVIKAVSIWARFFGPEASEDIKQFVNHQIL